MYYHRRRANKEYPKIFNIVDKDIFKNDEFKTHVKHVAKSLSLNEEIVDKVIKLFITTLLTMIRRNESRTTKYFNLVYFLIVVRRKERPRYNFNKLRINKKNKLN